MSEASADKILIVDDNELVLAVLRLTLEQAGFSVTAISSAFQLNRAIREDRPDLILLDVNMPALSGDKAASILGQYRFSQGIPVILHSDVEEDRLAELVEQTGATGFIRKTRDDTRLVGGIRRCLEQVRPS